jgi:hypothetical protein
VERWRATHRHHARHHFQKTDDICLEQRHAVVQSSALPTLTKIATFRPSTCFVAGFCLCQTPHGRALARFVEGFKVMLKAQLKPNLRPRFLYDKSSLVIRTKALTSCARWFLIVWGNLNSRRFGLLPLELSTDTLRLREAAATDNSIPLELNETSHVCNMWTAFRDEDTDASWQCSFYHLSTKLTRVINFLPAKNIWVSKLDDTSEWGQTKTTPRPPRKPPEGGRPPRPPRNPGSAGRPPRQPNHGRGSSRPRCFASVRCRPR